VFFIVEKNVSRASFQQCDKDSSFLTWSHAVLLLRIVMFSFHFFETLIRWTYRWVFDAWPVQRYTYGYLFFYNTRTSPLVGRYEKLHSLTMEACVWTACPYSLCEVERPGYEPTTSWLQVMPTITITSPRRCVTTCQQMLSYCREDRVVMTSRLPCLIMM